MKKLAVTALTIALGLGSTGCATNGIKATPQQIAADACTVSHLAVPVSIGLAYQYAAKNPEQQAQIQADIYQVAANLNALLSGGTVTPAQLTAALKVKEPYVQVLIGGLAGALTPYLTQLSQTGTNGAAATLTIIRCIAADAAAATHP